MNKKTFLFLFAIITTQLLFSQDIKMGSSLRGLTSLITHETRMRITDLRLWAENEIYEYEISSEVLLLISNNYYPFGVLVRDDEPYFLMDIDGDSILDTQTIRLFVPHWVISLNSKEKNNNTNITNIFDLWYTSFQNNESPRNSELVLSLGMEIVQAGNNLSYPNRDILYIHYLYDYLYTLGEYQLCLRYLELLDKTIISRVGGDTHVIIVI